MNAPSESEVPFSYYHVDITAPATAGRPAYTAECQDVIDALGMTFAEGCAFKAIWRNAAARTLGKVKPGSQGGLYDAKKVAYYGSRMVVAESNSAAPLSTEAAPPASPKPAKLELLPIVVGGKYRTRSGNTVVIEIDDGSAVPFMASGGRWYEPNGFIHNSARTPGQTRPLDLVERIS